MATEKRVTKANSVTGLTPSMAVAIFKRQYPGVPEAEIMKAALICQAYNLFPYGNQVYIIPFKVKDGDKWVEKWVTVISLHGLREIAKSTGNYYSYADGPRVMTEQEEIGIYGEVDKSLIRSIIKIKNKHGDIFPGYGIWRKADIAYGQDKGNTPHNMSFIRAERNAVDRMAPGVLPDAELVDASFVEVPVSQIVEQGNTELLKQAEEVKPKYDKEWLTESLKTLGERNEKVWNEENILSFMKKLYKVETPTVLEAVDKLELGMLKNFLTRIQEGLGNLGKAS